VPVIDDITADANTRIVLWHIIEDEVFFKSGLQLDRSELNQLQVIKSELKRKQWLASRLLIRMIIDSPGFIRLNKLPSGQPVLSDLDHHVSISHCGYYAAVIISRTSSVGIDIEVQADRILAIQHKFIGEQEYQWAGDLHNRLRSLIIWSAKESIFKWYAAGQVDFRKHIMIYPFESEEQGSIHALFSNGQVERSLKLNYRCYHDLVLTWLID
jgi:phosphopantetheinyl transferase